MTRARIVGPVEPRKPDADPMLNKLQQARAHLDAARRLRDAGRSYRQIGRELGLTSAQLCRIRRELKRERGAATRLRQSKPGVGPREFTINASSLPPALRRLLIAAGHRTLGDLADRVAEHGCHRLQTIAGIGPDRAETICRLLARHGLMGEAEDLQSQVEALFPEWRD